MALRLWLISMARPLLPLRAGACPDSVEAPSCLPPSHPQFLTYGQKVRQILRGKDARLADREVGRASEVRGDDHVWRRQQRMVGWGRFLIEELKREGVDTTGGALSLADGLGVEMPITRVIYDVLFDSVSATDAVARLMGRDPRSE